MSPRSWSLSEAESLLYKRDIEGLEFKQIADDLGRTKISCVAKYTALKTGPSPTYSCREDGAHITASASEMLDREVRYQLWLKQNPIDALLGVPLPGRSALDERQRLGEP